MTAQTQAVRIAKLERENTRLKLLCARLVEWHNLKVGPLETSIDNGMTLAIEFPNGTVLWPLDMKYVQGIWHQFAGKVPVDGVTSEQEELIISQLISGHMVHKIMTYFNAPDEEQDKEDD